MMIVLGIYVLVGFILYFLQEKFLFHPTSLPADHVFNFPIPFKEVNVAVNKEKNLNIVRFTVPDTTCRGVVLYFHGNRQNIERYAHRAEGFTRNNLEVWMIDYPGFGKTTGERSEQALNEDAQLLYRMARASFGKDSIILYGKSLGTGVAARLASLRDCRRLILETPYTSIEGLMRNFAWMYPVSLMAKYHFPIDSYFETITAPVTLFHGTNDETVRYSHSRKLIALPVPAGAQPRELITLEKGKHNNLYDFDLFQHKLDSVLQVE